VFVEEGDEVWAAADALRDRDAETRADIRRYRREMGLTADDAIVEWFFRQEERFSGRWLTGEEEAAAERREARIEAGAAAVTAYVEAHRDEFAGEWRHWSSGLPTIVVAFTGNVRGHRRALAELHPHPDVVEVVERRNSLARLEALMERAEECLDQLAELGIAWDIIGIDEENSRVELEIFAPDEIAARRVIAERLGDDVAVVHLGPKSTTVEPVPWHLWSVDHTDRRLTVHYATNTAYEPHSVEHDEDERAVKVTVLERMPAGITTLAATTRRATVDLSRPLGDRVVIDASTGDQRPQKGTSPGRR
jgi:hypothetical protein